MTVNNVGIYASQISGHLWAPNGAYDALATATLGSTTATVTFAGIPQGYKHLQIRYIVRTDMNSGGAWSPVGLRFNDDSAANYDVHTMGGTGASAFAESYFSQTSASVGFGAPSTNTANSFGVGVIDILDYNSSKIKNVRTLCGVENNGSGLVTFQSSAWFSTAAITSMTFRCLGGTNGSNFLANTQFALYGVK